MELSPTGERVLPRQVVASIIPHPYILGWCMVEWSPVLPRIRRCMPYVWQCIWPCAERYWRDDTGADGFGVERSVECSTSSVERWWWSILHRQWTMLTKVSLLTLERNKKHSLFFNILYHGPSERSITARPSASASPHGEAIESYCICTIRVVTGYRMHYPFTEIILTFHHIPAVPFCFL